MGAFVEMTIRFKNEKECLEQEASYDFAEYPENGLYWGKKIGKYIDGIEKVDDVITKLNELYAIDDEEDTFFRTREPSAFKDYALNKYDTIEIEETITDDFAYFELESISEDAGINPNSPMKSVYI